MEPYLSVVAVSRNDNHGGDPLIRTQIFINCLAEQCKNFKIKAELIIVDWNPVKDEKLLKEVLTAPDNDYFELKFLVVPRHLHKKFKYSDNLPLYQMIGKNVGIKRARGEYVLATNIDIIFSNELMAFIGEKNLKENEVYRVDRFDIRSGLNINIQLDEALEYAWKNVYYKNERLCDDELKKAIYGDLNNLKAKPNKNYLKERDFPLVYENKESFAIRSPKSLNYFDLHTNACGDFTLLSKKGWNELKGYAEFEAYSFNIDSCGLIAAHFNGYREISLLPPMVCFHIEHSLGSGWSIDGETTLFGRLEKAKILNPEWPILTQLFNEMLLMKDGKLVFNNDEWGLANFNINDEYNDDHKNKNFRVSSLIQSYDLDSISYWFSRTNSEYIAQLYEKNIFNKADYINTFFDAFETKIYIPDDITGNYNEAKSIAKGLIYIGNIYYNIEFDFIGWDIDSPLRFDPFDTEGEGEIVSIKIKDHKTGNVVYTIDEKNLFTSVIPINNISMITTNSNQLFRFKANGLDPYFYIDISKHLRNGTKYTIQIISSLSIKGKKAMSDKLLFPIDTSDNQNK